MTPITVNDDLGIAIGTDVVAHLEADEALDLAAELARRAFRLIAQQEQAAFILEEDLTSAQR